MRKIRFIEGQYYHIYNRGVEKRDIFMDRCDYERFLYLLFVCNDTKPLLNSQFYYRGLASIVKYPQQRELLVDIACFCLMPNHYHLLLRQRSEGGISLFMQKLGTAYTMYFNARQERNGVLLQGTFKAAHVDKELYLTHLSRYIHLNPLDLYESGWKEKGLVRGVKSYEFVKKYPWSSYGDFLGEERFTRILNRGLFSELYAPEQYEKFVNGWLAQDLEIVSKYTIEV